MNRVVILQPSYLPWIGYFDQIIRSDTFVFLDDVHYTKNDWRNRNRIKTPNGASWLTVPVAIKDRQSSNLLIKDARIVGDNILQKHLQAIQLNYKKAQYFNEVYDVISSVLQKNWEFLSDLDIELIKTLCSYLDISRVKFLKTSDLHIIESDPSVRLIEICKSLKATHYLTGESAKNYLNEYLFTENNIELEYQHFNHPTYTQLWGEFIPYLSIIDLLFNHGRKSLNIIENMHTMHEYNE